MVAYVGGWCKIKSNETRGRSHSLKMTNGHFETVTPSPGLIFYSFSVKFYKNCKKTKIFLKKLADKLDFFLGSVLKSVI